MMTYDPGYILRKDPERKIKSQIWRMSVILLTVKYISYNSDFMAYEVLINYLCVFHRGERVVSHGGVCCSRERRGVLYSTGRRRTR